MHSIITDFRAFHLLQKFVRSLLAALFRTFLQLLVNRVLFLTFELPKRTFSCSEGCRIYQQKLADREKGSFIMLCWGNSWNFFMLSTMLSSTVCFNNEEIVAPWRFKNLDKKTPLFLQAKYYITWLVKTQKSTTKVPYSLLCSPCDIASKRTNHKFGYFGEVRQSNILFPPKIPFFFFFFKKWGAGLPSPSPCAGPGQKS